MNEETRVTRKLAALASLITMAMLVGCADSGSVGGATLTDAPSPKVTVFAPAPSPYPAGKTSLDEANEGATFPLIVPASELANTSNIEAVFLYPEGSAVVSQFPFVAEPIEPVNSDHFEAWEGRWTLGDPAEVFQTDLDTYPVEGEKLFEVGGLPALGIEAHSATVPARDNSAFLRLRVDGVDVQISGGESLSDLVAIAESMIWTGSSPTPTTSP